MTIKKFERQTLQDMLGRGQTIFFGTNVYESLFQNKKWIVLILTTPYFHFNSLDNAPSMVDIFAELNADELNQLRNDPKTMFVFNYMWEGTSHLYYNFWEMITCSALRHNIPFQKIFFVSSNIKEEEQYDAWQKQHMPYYRINVISFNFFADFITMDTTYLEYYDIDQAVESIKRNQKLFLSLNRRLRTYRVYTIYKIFQSKILENTMISYDRLHPQYLQKLIHKGADINLDTYQQLVDSSPSVLDFSNFKQNWAGEPPEAAMPNKLFEKSLVSLVSETLFDTYNGTSLFYSEKSFKPMIFYHPVMIFGQPGLNTSLELVGFKQYNNYFDLSFDTIEDHVTRVNTQIEQLEILNDKLACMTGNQKVEWVFQDRDTLEYNKEALRAQEYNNKKLQKFIEIVKTITE
jgi:hypothetical protein